MTSHSIICVIYILLIWGFTFGYGAMEANIALKDSSWTLLDVQEFITNMSFPEDLMIQLGNNSISVDSVYDNLSEPCRSHVKYYDSSLKTGKKWALYMYDASTKFPESLLMGAVTQLGNYDECVDVRDVASPDGSVFHGQHCLANMFITLKFPINGFPTLPSFSVATCVPSSCNTVDTSLIAAERLKEELRDFQLFLSLINITPFVMNRQCHTADAPDLETDDWIVIGTLIFFGLIAALSTLYDLLTQEAERRNNLLLAFSVYTNGKKLFAMSGSGSEGTLHCLHGLRFISMAWVVLGHRYSTGIVMPAINVLSYTQYISTDWLHLWITNATLSVDTFFLISGLLVAYVFFRHVPKTNSFNIFMFYLHRYIRLTPALAVIIILQITLLRYVGSGPLWDTFGTYYVPFCQDNWWVTLLYLGNYVHEKRQCVIQAWYIATDMQLHWLSPLVLIPLWKWPKIGWFLMGSLTLGGLISNFVLSYVYKFTGTVIGPNAANVEDLNTIMYYPTHARFIPYLIGIALGYLLVDLQVKRRSIKFTKVVCLLLWLVTGGLLLLTLCIVQVFQEPGYEFEPISASLYNSLGRPGWALGTAMVVFLCVTGHGGVINSFLSWAWFQPLSRLCYSIYLVHISIQMSQISSVRSLIFLSEDSLMRHFFGDLMTSILCAVVLALMFESPFIVLEKELLSGKRKKKTTTANAIPVPSPSKADEGLGQGDTPEGTVGTKQEV